MEGKRGSWWMAWHAEEPKREEYGAQTVYLDVKALQWCCVGGSRGGKNRRENEGSR